MNQESQAQLQRALKQKKREAACAYLAKVENFDQDFLSKVRNLDNDDDYRVYVYFCMDGISYLMYEKFDAETKKFDERKSTVLFADNFASPHLIAFMGFCEDVEGKSPKESGIMWLERLFSFIKPKNAHLAKNQHDAAIARINNLNDSECIDFVNNSLNDFIEEFLS